MELIDQNGPKFHYQFEYKKRGGSTWQNKTLNATAEKFDIPNAGYYQLWDFRIRGVNEAGRGSVCSGNAYSSENSRFFLLSTVKPSMHLNTDKLRPGLNRTIYIYKSKYKKVGILPIRIV